jgi:hypothetical protein
MKAIGPRRCDQHLAAGDWAIEPLVPLLTEWRSSYRLLRMGLAHG